jgi:hypothetical protein
VKLITHFKVVVVVIIFHVEHEGETATKSTKFAKVVTVSESMVLNEKVTTFIGTKSVASGVYLVIQF